MKKEKIMLVKTVFTIAFSLCSWAALAVSPHEMEINSGASPSAGAAQTQGTLVKYISTTSPSEDTGELGNTPNRVSKTYEEAAPKRNLFGNVGPIAFLALLLVAGVLLARRLSRR